MAKRINPKRSRKRGQKASTTKGTSAPAVVLPSKPTEVLTDIRSYIGLMYGREKIGKTWTLSQIPDALFLPTEPGTKGLEVFEIQIESWATLRGAVDALVAEPDRFPVVVIDTVDRAYDMCLDWVCSNLNIPYPGQDSDGVEDYGKSWRAVRQEFTTQIHRIIKTGRGLWFTSHAKEQKFRSRSGLEYERVYPSMSKQAREVVEALVDFYLFVDYYRTNAGKDIRVIIAEGDETLWAGHRPPAQFPRFFELPKEGGFEHIMEAFAGNVDGLNPADLSQARGSMATTGRLIKKTAALAPKKKKVAGRTTRTKKSTQRSSRKRS